MDQILNLNQDLFFYIFALTGKNQLLDLLMIFGARYLIYILFGIGFIMIFREGIGRKISLLTLLSILIGLILLFTIGALIDEPRPFVTHNITSLIPHDSSDSFPSKHTTFATIIALPYLYYRFRYAWMMVLALVWISVGRVYTGVHYPIDILGGFIFGSAAVLISIYLKKFFFASA